MSESKAEFVHLHLHSHYSVLDGVSKIPAIFDTARQNDQPAVALTDHGNMFGIMEFYHESKNTGPDNAPNPRPIYGCELYIASDGRFQKEKGVKRPKPWHLVLLAQNSEGYKNLVKLSSMGYLEGFYRKPLVDHNLISEYAEGLIALTACLGGEIPRLILEERETELKKSLDFYIDTFGKERFYLELQDHGLPEQKIVNKRMIELSKETGLGLVATNDAHYTIREDAILQEIMFAIRDKTTMQDTETKSESGNNNPVKRASEKGQGLFTGSGDFSPMNADMNTSVARGKKKRFRYPNNEFYMKSSEEMSEIFNGLPEALSNTLKIAEMCQVELEFEKHLPQYKLPPKENASSYLSKLCHQGLKARFDGNIPENYQERLDRELAIIDQMGFSNYFLVVYDFVNYARRKNILVGPGRGSAAGAIVAYSLGITNIDPIRYQLLFERFLNPERVTMPDIDVDFQENRRDEVKEYIRANYGYDRTANVVTFGVAKAKAALRDVGRVLDIPLETVNKVAGPIDQSMANTPLSKLVDELSHIKEILEKGTEIERKWIEYSIRIDGSVRNLGSHASAMIISEDPLLDVIPLYLDKKNMVITTQYDGHYLEENGLLKMDILGLATLSLFQDCIDRIHRNHHVKIDLNKIPLDDPKVFETLARGETEGVFQFESEGMTEYIKQLKPNCIDDLIAMNALYRPGPMDNIPAYIARKQGREPVDCFHPKLEEILKPTYGVIVYQEQVMQIAQVLAGFSLGKADILRRAMAKKKAEQLDAMRPEWIEGAVSRGFEKKLAEKIFDILIPFSSYAFNKSHSAAYAVVATQTSYFKTYYYKEFMASLLTLKMGDTNDITKYTLACRQRNVDILPPDINHSLWEFETEGESIRFGFGALKGMGEMVADMILNERKMGGPFIDFKDFIERTHDFEDFKKAAVEILIKAGAFDCFSAPENILKERAVLLANLDYFIDFWTKDKKEKGLGQLSLFDTETQDSFEIHVKRDIPPLSAGQEYRMEMEVFGFYFSGRVFKNYDQRYGILSRYKHSLMKQLPAGTGILVIGIISEYQILNVGKKREYARFKLNTPFDTLSLFLFGEKHQSLKETLTNDRLVLVRLILTEGKRGLQYEVARIEPIESIVGQHFAELHLAMDSLADSEELKGHLQSLQKHVLEKGRGQTRLIFHTVERGEAITIEGSDRYLLKYSSELMTLINGMSYLKAFWLF